MPFRNWSTGMMVFAQFVNDMSQYKEGLIDMACLQSFFALFSIRLLILKIILLAGRVLHRCKGGQLRWQSGNHCHAGPAFLVALRGPRYTFLVFGVVSGEIAAGRGS